MRACQVAEPGGPAAVMLLGAVGGLGAGDPVARMREGDSDE
jgi:hypothetical protein